MLFLLSFVGETEMITGNLNGLLHVRQILIPNFLRFFAENINFEHIGISINEEFSTNDTPEIGRRGFG